jgi:two-component system cell cycle sensor histidine kinase/response regulator CckA
LINQGAHRGANIVRQLLTFSRGIPGARGVVQVRHLLREMVVLMRETFPREITVAEAHVGQIWPVMADATQIHQVLMNLCVNARDAMPNGGTLSLGAQNAVVEQQDLEQYPQARLGNFVQISVRDSGSGIPREYINRIFEPFFTTKELGKGTGLGLSTVLGIVKSHEGFLTVYSEIGRGSVFKVYLPADLTSVETVGAAPSAPARGQNELVLVVDDEPAIRATTTRVLETHGYRVVTASDGQEALNAFIRHQGAIQLVLTDLMMPKMGGLPLIRALRKLARDLPIVATSGLEDAERQSELNALGVIEILPKPVTPGDVLDAARRSLGRSLSH